jgi:hypothetical protein
LKNWLSYKRNWLLSLFELGVPCLLMLIMVVTRQQTKVTEYPSQSYRDAFLIYPSLLLSDSIYMHYPLVYDPVNRNHVFLEKQRFEFLGKTGSGRYQFDPSHCSKVRGGLRMFFGMSPRNELTEELLRQLMTWAYQWRFEAGYFNTFYALWFNTEQELLDYINHPDYEMVDDRPGLCAAVSHLKVGD